ncbi:hypothetical protein KR093_003755 [Drosophila rubida]|uniref:Coiled-coil domain-containing protein 137 n=1 Tax=Drosophila rubida TaxID=30044 RepID=A0AAD4PRE1_9MUSC|nr:hypothetical protein KR093_003755 [Drosophila rubida]
MARKRKIPVRKHHGVRDPLQQIEQREKKLANVTNNPPTQKDDQRGSYSFQQFKKLADTAKAGKKLKLGAVGKEDLPKASAGKHPKKAQPNSANNNNNNRHANIKQLADESDVDYLRRVNRMTSASVREAQYEAKYGVNVIRNPQTGEITIQKRPKNEIDELLKQKQKERSLAKSGCKKQQKKTANLMDAKTSKELIKRAYKEADEDEDEDDETASPAEYKRDVFKFGEIVHAPPTLKTLPRKANKNETVPRPGSKSNLLLKSLMEKPASSAVASQSAASSLPAKTKKLQHTTPTKQQLKGKRKDLPAATRNMLEGERSKMIDLYRQLKKEHNNNNQATTTAIRR